ncbi:hypothetical protein MJM59_29800, partial [Salmonella enterica subsp. enterica serovar Montevideo]|nr:hypothetical protein [Salmonella enterica subsp. enterica serovar Montevideo]
GLNFRIVYPNDREDLLKLIENNSRLCGVIFDWDKYNLELCEEGNIRCKPVKESNVNSVSSASKKIQSHFIITPCLFYYMLIGNA